MCEYGFFIDTLAEDSGDATWSWWLKLGEAVRKAVAEPSGLGRNDDARLRFVPPHNHLDTQLPQRDISAAEVVLIAMDLSCSRQPHYVH
jgi:hypothetical protein